MNTTNTRLAALAVLFGTLSLPALASSTASSAASDGSSASVGSVSDSFGTSSNSSSNTDKTAAGDYKVIEVARAADHPGKLRMKLQPVAGSGDDNAFFLYVPEQTLVETPVRTGQVVTARDRPYGTEFVKADTGKAFFLVLEDKVYLELQTRVVTL